MDALLDEFEPDESECHCSEVMPMHDCPAEECRDDPQTCNCCPACTNLCEMEI